MATEEDAEREKRKKMAKLDTRFADEEDAQDIANLVNKAYAVEDTDGQGGAYAFRKGERLLMTELSESTWCSTPNSRWLVCETPVPEERMVACLHFRLSPESSTAYITCLAVDKDMQRKGVGGLLLRRAESIIRNFSCRYTKMEAAHCRDDVESFAKAMGYTECGGGMDAELSSPEVTKPATRFVMYQKDLRVVAAPPPSSSSGPLFATEEEATTGGEEEEEEEDESSSNLALMATVVDALESLGFDTVATDASSGEGSSGGLGGMEGGGQQQQHSEEVMDRKGAGGDGDDDGDDIPLEDIIGELFKALRTDEGRAEFERLVKEQEQPGGEEDEQPVMLEEEGAQA